MDRYIHSSFYGEIKVGPIGNRLKLLTLYMVAVFLLLSWSVTVRNSFGENHSFVQMNKSAKAESKDIKWFKDTMKISPKYQENNKEILGLSWAHFLFMAFLMLFVVGVFTVAIMKNRRTKELIETLVKEEGNGAEGHV